MQEQKQRSCHWIQAGDGGEEKSSKPGPRQRKAWVSSPKTLSRKLVNNHSTLVRSLPFAGDSRTSWSQTASISFNQLSGESDDRPENAPMYTQKAWEGTEQCMRSDPFLYQGMDKELSWGTPYFFLFLYGVLSLKPTHLAGQSLRQRVC